MSDTARKRRRFWSLVGFVALLVALVSVPVAWKINQVDSQQRVVAEVEKLKGELRYDYQVPAASCVIDNDPHIPPGPEWLRGVVGDDFFAHVVQVIIRDNEPADETIALVSTLPHLQLLGFKSDRVTDAALAHVARLPDLENLKFLSASITDEGLLHLQQHKRLTNLGLLMPRLTDRGLATIGKLSQLESLVIRSDQVTDDGLLPLAKLSRLTHLHLYGTKVTAAGLAAFKQVNTAQVYVDGVAANTR